MRRERLKAWNRQKPAPKLTCLTLKRMPVRVWRRTASLAQLVPHGLGNRTKHDTITYASAPRKGRVGRGHVVGMHHTQIAMR